MQENHKTVQDVVNLAKYSNIEGMDELDIEVLLTLHNHALTNKELMQLELQFMYEGDSTVKIN